MDRVLFGFGACDRLPGSERLVDGEPGAIPPRRVADPEPCAHFGLAVGMTSAAPMSTQIRACPIPTLASSSRGDADAGQEPEAAEDDDEEREAVRDRDELARGFVSFVPPLMACSVSRPGRRRGE